MAVFNVVYPPIDYEFLDKDGKVSNQWSDYFRSLTNLTSNNFNSMGLNAPTLDPSEFSGEENGSIFYDNEAKEPKMIVEGVVKTITTT